MLSVLHVTVTVTVVMLALDVAAAGAVGEVVMLVMPWHKLYLGHTRGLW